MRCIYVATGTNELWCFFVTFEVQVYLTTTVGVGTRVAEVNLLDTSTAMVGMCGTQPSEDKIDSFLPPLLCCAKCGKLWALKAPQNGADA